MPWGNIDCYRASLQRVVLYKKKKKKKPRQAVTNVLVFEGDVWKQHRLYNHSRTQTRMLGQGSRESCHIWLRIRQHTHSPWRKFMTTGCPLKWNSKVVLQSHQQSVSFVLFSLAQHTQFIIQTRALKSKTPSCLFRSCQLQEGRRGSLRSFTVHNCMTSSFFFLLWQGVHC